jgi:hypothetical protein
MTQIICPKCKEEFDDLEVDDFADIDCILQIGKCFNCGKKPNCIRCNDNGCPSCDGTKGSLYNPEPF